MKPNDFGPMMPRPMHWWTYGRGGWDGPLVSRGGDEWGRYTLAFRLPGHRALVIPYRWCRDPGCESGCGDRCPETGQPHGAWIDGRVSCQACNPTEPRLCAYCHKVMHPLAMARWVIIGGSVRPAHYYWPGCRTPPSLLDRWRVWWGNHVGSPED